MSWTLGSVANGNWLFRWRSYLPLLVLALSLLGLRSFHYPYGSHLLDQLWELACLLISLAGFGIRFATAGQVPKGTSGRNTRKQAATGLNTTGPYSVVRNPLYLGNYLIWLGVSLILRQWWLPVVTTLIFAFCHWRIILAEEAYLLEKFGTEFTSWARWTPAFFPRVNRWRKSALPFSLKTALRREYLGLLGIITVFTFFETITDFIVERHFVPDVPWLILFSVTLVSCGVIRFLTKKTDLFRIEGR